ncbi:hypothetical protein BJ684DRAFT_18093, partial [Piptocephalis cylindrospora]
MPPSFSSFPLADLVTWHLRGPSAMGPATSGSKGKGKGKRREVVQDWSESDMILGQSSFRDAQEALSSRDLTLAALCRKRLEGPALNDPIVGQEQNSPDLHAILPPEDPFYFSLLDQQVPLNASQYPSVSSETSISDPVRFDREWFLGKCQAHIDTFSSSDDSMSLSRLSTHLLTLLRSSRSDEDIQNELVDLLGYDFDLLSLLLVHRSELLSNLSEKDSLDSLFTQEPIISTPKRTDSPARHRTDPTTQQHMGNLIISSKSQKDSEKALRKEKKRLHQARASTRTELDEEESIRLLQLDPSELRRAREEQLQMASNAPLASSSVPLLPDQPHYPHVYSSTRGNTGGPISSFASQYILPVGTERMDER